VYAGVCVLDNGRPFVLEDFQEEIAADIFAGFQESWLILPEGSGKTTFLALLALYYGDYTPSAMIPIAASSREQAEIMYRQAEGLIVRSPELQPRFRAYDGYRRIKCLRTEGRIQVYAADDRTGDGIIPGGLALVDELHRHRDLKLYRTWKGKLDKRGAQLVTISTAGEPGGDFEDTRAHIRRSASDVSTSRDGCHVRAAGEDIVLHDFAVPSIAQSEDMAVVAQANPRREVTAERLRKKRDSPTMTREHWLRFVCNIATLAGGSGIAPEEWDELREDGVVADRDAPAFGWLDLGWKIDTTALGAIVWESPVRRVVSDVLVLPPPVNEADIAAGLLRLQARFNDFRGVVYDPNAGGQQMAQLLERGQHPLQTDDDARELAGLPRLDGQEAPQIMFIEHSQDNAPMADAAAKLDEAIRNKWLVHNGDRVLRKHVLNAVSRSLGGEKWKFDRPGDAKGEKRGRYPIDALTGLLMGHRTALAESGRFTGPLIEVFG
jgi:phage terminase large subunit-like protein